MSLQPFLSFKVDKQYCGDNDEKYPGCRVSPPPFEFGHIFKIHAVYIPAIKVSGIKMEANTVKTFIISFILLLTLDI